MLTKSLFAVLAATAAMAQMINTPASLIQCQPAQLTFSGGTPPYIIAVLPGGQVSAPAILTINDNVQQSPLTWNVNLPSGSNITFRITDSTGAIGYSSPSVIQTGTSASCLNTTASNIPTGSITGSASASGSSSSGASASSSASVTSSASRASSASAAASSAASSIASVISSASGGVASSIASVSAAASSVAATSSRAGAYPTAVAGAGALAAGVIGGIAMLF